MKKSKAEKLKKVHILPVVIVLFVVIVLIVTILLVTVATLIDNLTNVKISEGYAWTASFYKQIGQIDTKDTKKLEQTFSTYSSLAGNLCGISIEKDEKEIYRLGETMSENRMDAESIFELEIDNEKGALLHKIYLDTSEKSYLGLCRSKDESFSLLMGEIFESSVLNKEVMQISPYNTEAVCEQICYYGFENPDGSVTYLTYTVYVTRQDIFFVGAVGFCIFIICLIYLIFVVYLLIRFAVNQSKLLRLYYADKETGGKNWYYFIEKASKKMRMLRRANKKSAMVHIRMEKFRSYCSCYGDREGQKLLEDFYDVIQKNVKRREAFSRHEICDFGLLLCYDSEEKLVQRVQKIMKQMDEKRPDVKLYFNAGINLHDKEKIDPPESYNRATIARNKIEDNHNVNISFFTQEMKENLLWERKVENDMERALRNHEYKVYLQPKYSVGREKLAAAEALVRWQHPIEGLLSPNKFIPIFERNGFITKLDDYMIAEVAKLQAGWIEQGKKIVPISVNVSRAHFTRDNLAEHICKIVDYYHVPHDAIELELTESAFFDDKQTLIDIVKKMKAYGFVVSMDDFGAGYSSLNSLKELPIDVVKLDAEFFRGQDEEGKGKVIVGEAISLAKKLHMRIVAEGIETREQVDFLAENACDLIQGFYFAKPMPVADFEKKVEVDADTDTKDS